MKLELKVFLLTLLFGLGISFIILGWPLVKRLNNTKSAVILYISISWLLISWWPHDNFHLSVGEGIHLPHTDNVGYFNCNKEFARNFT